jgi:hypothetical protein
LNWYFKLENLGFFLKRAVVTGEIEIGQRGKNARIDLIDW